MKKKKKKKATRLRPSPIFTYSGNKARAEEGKDKKNEGQNYIVPRVKAFVKFKKKIVKKRGKIVCRPGG